MSNRYLADLVVTGCLLAGGSVDAAQTGCAGFPDLPKSTWIRVTRYHRDGPTERRVEVSYVNNNERASCVARYDQCSNGRPDILCYLGRRSTIVELSCGDSQPYVREMMPTDAMPLLHFGGIPTLSDIFAQERRAGTVFKVRRGEFDKMRDTVVFIPEKPDTTGDAKHAGAVRFLIGRKSDRVLEILDTAAGERRTYEENIAVSSLCDLGFPSPIVDVRPDRQSAAVLDSLDSLYTRSLGDYTAILFESTEPDKPVPKSASLHLFSSRGDSRSYYGFFHLDTADTRWQALFKGDGRTDRNIDSAIARVARVAPDYYYVMSHDTACTGHRNDDNRNPSAVSERISPIAESPLTPDLRVEGYLWRPRASVYKTSYRLRFSTARRGDGSEVSLRIESLDGSPDGHAARTTSIVFSQAANLVPREIAEQSRSQRRGQTNVVSFTTAFSAFARFRGVDIPTRWAKMGEVEVNGKRTSSFTKSFRLLIREATLGEAWFGKLDRPK